MNSTVPPGYKQTEVGVIPEEWEVKEIRDVCKLINGRGFKPHEWQTNGLPIIRIQNLNGSEEFNCFQGSYDKKLEIEPGQLLFAWSGSRGTSFGPHIWSGRLGLLNYHTWKVQIKESEIDSAYFFHALKKLTTFIEDKAHGASALVHTQKWEMEGFELAVPPTKAEQRAIGAALSDVDALIGSLDKLIAKKRDMKQAAMQELLTGKHRLPGFSNVGAYGNTPNSRGECTSLKPGECHSPLPGVPHGWEVKRLGEVCFFENGDRGNNYPSPSSFIQSGTPFVNAGHIAEGHINLAEMDYISSESYERLGSGKFKSGDILFCLRGSLGKFGIVGETFGKGAIASSLVIVRPKTANIRTDFLGHYFNSQLCVQMIEKWAGGAAQPNLGAQDLAKFEVSLPPLPEQTAIAAILSDMDTEIAALEQKRDKTRLLKQGMMQELLTGRIRLV